MQFAMAAALYGHQGLWGGPFLVRGLDLEVGVAARLLLVLGLSATVGFLVAGPAAGRFGRGAPWAAAHCCRSPP
jgi:hypothetical protein